MAKANRVHSTPRRTASKTAANADPIFRAIDNHRQLFKRGSIFTIDLIAPSKRPQRNLVVAQSL